MREQKELDSVNNKRIAKNTIFLYLRMFFSMGVSLYTSRVILEILGILDYGIWNIVAGVIAMFSFLNISMSTATSRFLMFELGKKNKENYQQVFSGACTIHLVIAILVFLLGETIGLWFLLNKLVIPINRMFAAIIVYQIAVFSTMINIMQVPYNASIMANERMNIYAYVEMVNTALRLVIVISLYFIPFDKLIVYGLLSFFITLVIAIFYKVYCSKMFIGCKYIISRDKNIIKPMLSFSGWDLYGNLSVMARTQGVNILLNLFFTVSMNAASGIATQVQTAVMNFASNIVQAFRPQIIKSYAVGNYDRMSSLILKAAQYTSMLLLLFTIPLCLEIEYVLSIWLMEVPSYTAIFCIYTLVFNIFTNIAGCVVYGIHATGKVKRISVINGTLYLLVIPISFLCYKLGGQPQIAYLFNVCAVICGMLSNIYTLHVYVSEFSIKSFIVNVLFKTFIIAAFTIFVCSLLKVNMDSSFWRLVLISCASMLCIIVSTYIFIMNKSERMLIINRVKNAIWRN